MTESRPNALYLYAHPEARSFNRELFDAARAELELTHDVVASDLYAMGFDPLLDDRDLGSLARASGSFISRWTRATAESQLPEDIRVEQQKLLDADLVVLQFPLWWYSMPAILKGWFDRVLTAGFGFDVVDPETGLTRRYGDGLLTGKRVLIVVSYGESDAALGPRGIAGDLDTILYGLTHGVLFYTGCEVLPLHGIEGVDGFDSRDVAREITRLRERIAGFAAEAPIPFRSLESGDYTPERVLRDEVAPGRTDLGIHRTDA
ncbi:MULTISPECIES: NAD(P)H-dependent oxidoreductase [unclassified Leucobacter]|uniref:NAD(P)H-dependent oxidoreductase n=1 Tax=unclassified Leucobacter TaxID=2621730 RepID=UPI0006223280|nr:NAD(P)H-dependent oxidoreductase [Leucobacter sp. Ag1]KKI21573.1 NADPH-quinone reductase [Leucobacter sp. Ag1]